MSVFLRKVVVISFILIVCLCLISEFLKYGYKHADDHAVRKLYSIFEEDLEPEILILGSSIAEGAINSNILSERTQMKAYNAALSGRKINDWICVADHFLSKSTPPEIVIFDIFPTVFNEHSLLYNPQDFYPYLDKTFVKEALKSIGEPYSKIASVPFYELTAINAIYVKRSLSSWKNLILNKPKNAIHKDYIEVESSTFNPKDFSHFKKINISKESVELYESLFSKCEKNEVVVIMIAMPIFYIGKEKYENWNQVVTIAMNFEKEFPNVHFLDYSNNSSFLAESDLFANHTHLNTKGADLLSRLISHRIEELFEKSK